MKLQKPKIKKMTLATAKKTAVKGSFAARSLRECEKLLVPKHFKTVRATAAQKRAFLRAEKNFQEGKSISWEDAKKELGIKN